MFDDLSESIRDKKKQRFRPALDSAGHLPDPNEAWDKHQNDEVSKTLGDPDHEPASPTEMGEHESSQDKVYLKKSIERIKKYLDSMMFE
jgi:hypothetical protein